MSAWNDGSPSAFAHPEVNTMRVTAHGCAAPTEASAARVPARIVCTVVVHSRMRRRGIRWARRAAERAGERVGEEAGGGDESRPAGLTGGGGDEDSDPDGLHPRADVRRERADPQARRSADAGAERGSGARPRAAVTVPARTPARSPGGLIRLSRRAAASRGAAGPRNISRTLSKDSRHRPAPTTTVSRGISTRWTGTPGLVLEALVKPRSRPPPPTRWMPWAMRSWASSGGASPRHLTTESTMAPTCSSIASRTSFGDEDDRLRAGRS